MAEELSPFLRSDQAPLSVYRGLFRFPQIPVPLSPLIGRDHLLPSLEQIVLDPRNRLVTLTGPGGVGKTRLALQAAIKMETAFADGVAYVDLTAVRDPAQVPSAIVRSLGLYHGDTRSSLSMLKDALRSREVLLVLDNFEQVVSAGIGLSDLLQVCPRLTALVTSRSHLNLSGEHIFGVPPLSLALTHPAQSTSRDADSTVSEPVVPDAVQLFVDRSRHILPTFVVTRQNASAIAEVDLGAPGVRYPSAVSRSTLGGNVPRSASTWSGSPVSEMCRWFENQNLVVGASPQVAVAAAAR